MAIHLVSEEVEELEQRYRELFDTETGLAGELLLRDRVAISLARARRFNRWVLVVWFEISPPADPDPARVTRALAGALQDAVRPDDTVARVSDWEFVVLCNDLAHEEAVERIVRRLHAAIRRSTGGANGSEPLARIGTALGQADHTAQHVLARARRGLRPVRAAVATSNVM